MLRIQAPHPTPTPKTLRFGNCKTPYAEIWKFCMPITTGTPIHVYCFKNGGNPCRISGQKAALYFYRKKNILPRLVELLGDFPNILSDTLLLFITYRPIPSFVQIGSGLESYSGKILPLPAEVIEMCRLFEPLIKSSRTRKSRHWVRCLRDIQSCTSWCSRLQTLGHQSDASARFPHSVHERKLS